MIEKWELTFTACGGTHRLNDAIYELKKIARKYDFSCNMDTIFNLIFFKKIEFVFTGECTEKYANKFKNEIVECCYKFCA